MPWEPSPSLVKAQVPCRLLCSFLECPLPVCQPPDLSAITHVVLSPLLSWRMSGISLLRNIQLRGPPDLQRQCQQSPGLGRAGSSSLLSILSPECSPGSKGPHCRMRGGHRQAQRPTAAEHSSLAPQGQPSCPSLWSEDTRKGEHTGLLGLLEQTATNLVP